MEGLMSWSPFPLEVAARTPGSFELEKNIHACLADLHSHREWFRSDPRITQIIDRLNAGLSIDEAMDLGAHVDLPSRKALAWRSDPDRRLKFSYGIRLSWAERKLQTPTHFVRIPSDVEAIMRRWSKDRRLPKGDVRRRPTAEEFARLDAVIADPGTHLVRLSFQELAA